MSNRPTCPDCFEPINSVTHHAECIAPLDQAEPRPTPRQIIDEIAARMTQPPPGGNPAPFKIEGGV